MKNKNEIINYAVKYMESMVGLPYSRKNRYNWYKGGSTDCSGFVYAAFLAAGYPLLMDGVERMTSTYEVYADGFDLLYPAKESEIGQKITSKGFYKDFDWEKGDIIFYTFNNTTRANKITHVAVCYDKNHIIHTANVKENACIKDISYGDGHIVAVIRLKQGATEMQRKQIGSVSTSRIHIRRMQTLLNTFGSKLICDGILGSKTFTALRAFQDSKGLTPDGVCGAKTWAALCGETDKSEEKDEPIISCSYTFYRNLKLKMTGDDVRALQELLKTHNFTDKYKKELTTDGVFGSNTLYAVKTAQKTFNLTDDGIAGKKTIEALGGKFDLNADPNLPKGDVTICTFNIKRGTYQNGSYARIASIIKDTDIVGIQEVTPTGIKNIANYAGKPYHMCQTIANYGHAIISNFTKQSENITTLSGTGERRKLHHIQYGDVSYYNVHFHYTETSNKKQLDQVASIIAKDKSKVIILTGDFNRQDFEPFINAGFKQVNAGQKIRSISNSTNSIVNKIDNIFIKGAADIIDIWKYDAVSKKYSDHDALFVKVKLR